METLQRLAPRSSPSRLEHLHGKRCRFSSDVQTPAHAFETVRSLVRQSDGHERSILSIAKCQVISCDEGEAPVSSRYLGTETAPHKLPSTLKVRRKATREAGSMAASGPEWTARLPRAALALRPCRVSHGVLTGQFLWPGLTLRRPGVAIMNANAGDVTCALPSAVTGHGRASPQAPPRI